MKMSEAELSYLNWMRALTTNSKGEICFVGLNRKESEEFYVLSHQQDVRREHVDRYLELHAKHEKARLSVVAGEVELRNNQGPVH